MTEINLKLTLSDDQTKGLSIINALENQKLSDRKLSILTATEFLIQMIYGNLDNFVREFVITREVKLVSDAYIKADDTVRTQIKDQLQVDDSIPSISEIADAKDISA